MNHVSLTALRAFERTVAKGSQRAAGHDLGVTQTAVSHAIRTLEEQLGVRLFHRRAAASSLTPQGQALVKELSPAFARIGRALADLRDEGAFTVSTTPAFAACWLAPALTRLAQEEALSVRIEATTQIADLSRGDVAVSVRYAAKANGERLTREVFQAVVGRSVRLCDGIPKLPRIETRWRHGPRYAPTWANWFEACGAALPGDRTVHFRDEHQVLQAVLAGSGVGLVSSVLAAPLLDQGLLQVVRPDIALEGLAYWLFVAPERRHERKVAAFTRWLRDSFATGAALST